MNKRASVNLTQPEIDFPAPIGYEVHDSPFTSPATEALKARGVFPAEILTLQQAYIVREVTLNPNKGLPVGYPSPKPPSPCPWPSREEALRRDRELQVENEER
jgi:hypothetical protein